MEVFYPRCCGLDVHKSSITACVLIAQSGKPLKHIRRFGCTTRELRDLVVWLQAFSVEQVAMESTGVYWKPVWNVLESHFQIVLANAQPPFFNLIFPIMRYINSSMNDRAASGGIRVSACRSGPAFSTGSAPCNVDTSVRSKNFPIGISSPHSRDFPIAAIQSVGS
jgi:Transposase